MPVYMNGELVLYGFVGDNYWREGFTSTEVLEALAEHGTDNDLDVRLNSGGGYAFEGLAIYNALHVHKGNVTIHVDAIAASAASTIAMAGDKIIMRAGSEMMIHDPSGYTFGTAEQHQKAMAALDKLGSQMASVYGARSGNDADKVRQVMKDETWFTAEEAVAAGYANQAEEAKAETVSAFDYRIYSKAPDHLVALAAEKNWSLDKAITRSAASAAPTSQQETPMADKPKADDKPADTAAVKAEAATETKARIKEITGLEEASGREALAQHIAFDTEMDVEAAKVMLAAAPKSAEPTATVDDATDPAKYEADRLRASGQAQPGGMPKTPSASLNSREIFAARRATLKGA
ncbi:head maturation protease, ClpP-related [Roseibium sp.]|uniref:head maturation protease, ClpP-related n=1 Tax=Roseibium sp. TaxID=1936156 RepID=UPI003299384B